MKTKGGELNSRCLKWIVARELQAQLELKPFINLAFSQSSVSQSCCYEYSAIKERSKVLTVSFGPTMVPTQLKILSPSGNAEIPGSPDVCSEESWALHRSADACQHAVTSWPTNGMVRLSSKVSSVLLPARTISDMSSDCSLHAHRKYIFKTRQCSGRYELTSFAKMDVVRASHLLDTDWLSTWLEAPISRFPDTSSPTALLVFVLI